MELSKQEGEEVVWLLLEVVSYLQEGVSGLGNLCVVTDTIVANNYMLVM